MTWRRDAVALRGQIIALAIFTGCAGEHQGTEEAVVWELEADPVVTIGLNSERPEAALHLVVDAVELRDGSIAVANGGLESRLPVFSPSGEYLRSIGGQGDGPGEFRWITGLEVGPGDSLYVFDASLQRLTAFSPDGEVRTTSFRVTGNDVGTDRLRLVGRLNDDVWVGKGMEDPMDGEIGEIIQDTIAIDLLDAGLSTLTRLTYLPGMMSTTFLIQGRRAFGSAPHTPYALQAIWGQCVFVGAGQDANISVYSVHGDLVTVFEGPGELRRTTQRDVDSWIERRMRLVAEDDREAFRQAFGEITYPSHLPYYSQMVADPSGRLWVQEYAAPQGTGGLWHVLSQTGVPLGTVLLPKPMTVFEITGRGAIGRTVGPLDEEYVEVIPLNDLPFESGLPFLDCVSG